MNEFPLVSILIPLYNAEKYFSETMESLLAQTYPNIEIIIVDDGSTDNSLNIAREYENQYEHIKVCTQKNSGAQIARNKAFELSLGEYIQYFDADDIMHPNKIATQMEVLRQYDFQDSIVATGKWMTFLNSIDNAAPREQIINKDYDDKFLFFKEAWENGEYIIGQSWLIHRMMNEKIGNWDIQLTKHQDGEFFTRVAYRATKIVFVKESLFYYRKGIANSISSDKSIKGMMSHLYFNHMRFNIVKNDLEKHSLHKAVAKLYSEFYAGYFPLDKQMKEEVCGKLKSLGFDHPIIEFKPKYLWIVKLFGVDTGLYLGRMKSRFLGTVSRLENIVGKNS